MSRVPYGVISDTHNHGWSQFATVSPEGVNSRLQTILDETVRAAETTRAIGGSVLFHAGDLFHVRGVIVPSVLNPTKDTYSAVVAGGFDVNILAGNHDLEGKESTRIGSAVTALEDTGCNIVNEPSIIRLGEQHIVCMVPWVNKVSDLKVQLERMATRAKAEAATHRDLIIHAPVDGVIVGLPDHGLTPAWLAALGFDLVFSGHYHNHKDLGNGVFSIGALTHHTWGDIGSKAGFLTVDDTGAVKYNAQHAPDFIELDASVDPADIPLLVPNNFVRVKVNSAKASDLSAVRQIIEDAGASGVVVLPQVVATAPVRAGTTVTAGETMEKSLASYISAGTFTKKEALNALCADILATVKASSASA